LVCQKYPTFSLNVFFIKDAVFALSVSCLVALPKTYFRGMKE
jgi:hypothetical protein